MSTTPPIAPINSFLWDTLDPEKILTTGDVVAEPGDVVTKWISNDGTKTATAQGSPTLRRRPYSPTYNVIEFDGANDGFLHVDGAATLDGQLSGSFLFGGMLNALTGALPRAAGCVAAANTTSRQQLVGAFATSVPNGIGVMEHGGAIDFYSNGNELSQAGAFAQCGFSSDGTTPVLYGSLGDSYQITSPGNASGAFIPQSEGSFPKVNISIGYEAISTPRGYWPGDIAYAGWWSQHDLASRKVIADWYEARYPTRGVILAGDSRFNGTVNDAIALIARCPVHEVATGGNSLSQAKVQLEEYTKSSVYSYSPTTIVILAGVNNTIGGGSLASLQQGLIELVNSALGAADVILCNETPCRGNVSASEEEADIHEEFAAWISTYDWGRRVMVIDTFGVLEDPYTKGAMRSDLTSDNLHPNGDGYALLAEFIGEAIRNFKPTVAQENPEYAIDGFSLGNVPDRKVSRVQKVY